MKNKTLVKNTYSTSTQKKFARVTLTKKATKALKGGDDFVIEDIVML